MHIEKLTPIMYVDDDSDDQEIFKSALVTLKVEHPLLSFWNGAAALQYLISGNINPFIIFCDINMPVMNGFELRKHIIESKKLLRSCIPFIFYSTNADNASVDMAYELTVQGYFKKPSALSDIIAQLKRIINYWLECRRPGSLI